MAHTYWRINVTQNSGDASFLAIAEVELRATVGGADQCSGGTASASSADAVGPSPASNAFDNNATTRWSTPSGTLAGWLKYAFAVPVDVVQYTIQAHPTAGARSPSWWTLEYSDDDATWFVADTRAGESSWSNGQIKTFAFAPLSVNEAQVSKFNAYAVMGGPNDAASATKLTAYAVQGGPDDAASATKLTAYAVTEAVAASSARPQVFVVT